MELKIKKLLGIMGFVFTSKYKGRGYHGLKEVPKGICHAILKDTGIKK